jgi:hypothetical protein
MLPAPRSPEGLTIREHRDLAGPGSAASIMPVTNAIERRLREVRRRTRPMGTFQDKTSMERILFAVFMRENCNQDPRHPLRLLTQTLVPHLANYVIDLPKEIELCFIIAAPELVLRAMELASSPCR